MVRNAPIREIAATGESRAANRGGRWVLTSGSHSARCGTGRMRRRVHQVVEEPREAQRSRSGASLARGSLAMTIEGIHRPLPGFSCASSRPLEQGRCSRSPLAAPRELRDSGRGPRPMPPTRPISTGRLDAEANLAAARSFRTTRPTRTPARTPRCWRAAAEFAAPWLFPDAGDGGDAAASEPDAGIADGSRADAYADDATAVDASAVDAAEGAGLCHPCGVVVHLDE